MRNIHMGMIWDYMQICSVDAGTDIEFKCFVFYAKIVENINVPVSSYDTDLCVFVVCFIAIISCCHLL